MKPNDRIDAVDADNLLTKAGLEVARADNYQWIYATDQIGTHRINVIGGTVNRAQVIGILASKGFDPDGNRVPPKTYGAQNIQGVIDLFEMRAAIAANASNRATSKGAKRELDSEAHTWRTAVDILRSTEFVGWKQSP